MAKEYIERDALLKRMEERLAALRREYGDYDHYTDGFEEGCVAVEDATAADVVEVVRCKDCEAWQENPWSKGEMVCKCWAEWLPTEPDDFCSCGERRTNDGNKENL
jgi:hypothetical protein